MHFFQITKTSVSVVLETLTFTTRMCPQNSVLTFRNWSETLWQTPDTPLNVRSNLRLTSQTIKRYYIGRYEKEPSSWCIETNQLYETIGSGLVLDFGRHNTTMYFIHDNKLRKSFELSVGGYNVSSMLESLMKSEKRSITNCCSYRIDLFAKHFINDQECAVIVDFEKTMHVNKFICFVFQF
jgi:hypothetical protein